ncbi:hypothetical protein [Streptomyces sp. NPDC057301]|uniref:hypothetical protein n=1 Tax=Streptomyces sp. NPDC057301 TaxID=3346093 RepID=UPI00362F43EC
MRYEITSPTPGHTGLIAGVPFVAGRALVDDPPAGALLYFRRHSFTIAPEGAEPFPAGFVANETKPAPRPRSKQRAGKDTTDGG